MSFRFSLDAVLRLRESVERREERALQKIQLGIARVRMKIEQAGDKIAECQRVLSTRLKVPLPAAESQILYAEVEALSEERQTLFLELERLLQEQRAQLESYRAAHRARQMLTDMRAEQQATYERTQEQRLQKRLDDIFAAQSQNN